MQTQCQTHNRIKYKDIIKDVETEVNDEMISVGGNVCLGCVLVCTEDET